MDSEQDEEEDVYEVERIIDMRVEDGENLYLVRWKNFSSDDDTWEPKAHLEDCREVLLAYERSLAEKKLKKDSSMKLTMKNELFDANSESDSDKDKLKESPSKKKKKHAEDSEDKKSEKDKKKKKEKWKEDQPLPAPESDEEEERVPTLPPTKKDKPTDSKKRAIKKEEDENDDAPAKKRKKEIKVKDGGKQKKEIVEERKKEKAKSEKEIESSGDETDKSDAPSELYADDTSSTGNLRVTAKPTTAKTTEKSSRSESGSDHSKANQKKNKSELKLQGFKDLVQDMNPKKTDSSALLLRESGLNKSKSLTSSKSSSKSSRSEDEPDFSDAGAIAKAKSKPKGLDSNSAPQKDLSGSSSSTVLAAPSKPREEERPKEQKEETVEKGAAPNNLFEKFLLNCEAKDRVPRKQAAHTPKSSVKPDKKAREESPVQKTEFDQVKEGTIAMEADERREKSAQESEKSDRSNEPVAEMKEDVQPELRDAVKNGNHMAVKRALGSKEDYNLDQQATLIHRRSPAVSISKQQLSALTRRLVDLEAKVGLLEARLNERSHPSTADKSMATDSPVDVLPTPVEPRTECQQVTHIHPSGYGEFSLTNEHLDIDSFGFPSAVSTPCIDRNHSEDIAEDSDYLNHQLTMLDYNYSPVQESASTMSNTSEQCPSAMSSFCLRLPETPRNASNFQSHNSVRRSLMGVILQDVTLNHVSMEVEKQLYADAAGSDGTPRADRFAAGLFKRLIPLTVCHEWVGSVSYDGSKGKNALPLNVRQAISDAVARKFHPSLSDWKLVRDRINELLRKKRLSIPLF